MEVGGKAEPKTTFKGGGLKGGDGLEQGGVGMSPLATSWHVKYGMGVMELQGGS